MTSFRPRTTHGYAAVVSYDILQSTAEEMKFLNVLKIVLRKNQDGGSVTLGSGTSRTCLRTRDGYPTDNPGLRDVSGVQTVKVRTKLCFNATHPHNRSPLNSLKCQLVLFLHLPCNIQLCTQLPYNFPIIRSETSIY